MGAKAVAHPKESLWGGQLTFASNGEGLDAVTLLRADARYAFSQDDLRLYAYFGFNYIDGKVSSRAAAAVPSLEGGGGVEVRWVPGAGFSFEMGPMIAFSGDPNVSMLGFYFDFSVIIWTDLW